MLLIFFCAGQPNYYYLLREMEEICLVCLILLIIDFKRQKEFSIISKIISNIFKFENSHTLLQNVMYHIDSGFLDKFDQHFLRKYSDHSFFIDSNKSFKIFFLEYFCPFEHFFYFSHLSKWDFQQKQMQATITSKKWYCLLHLVMQ